MRSRLLLAVLVAVFFVPTAYAIDYDIEHEDSNLGVIEVLVDLWLFAWEAFGPTIVPTGEPAPSAPEIQNIWEAAGPTIVSTGAPATSTQPSNSEARNDGEPLPES